MNAPPPADWQASRPAAFAQAPDPIPASIESEQALLGAILINNEAWGCVADFLLPEHFAEELHRRIYDVASQMIRSGKIATPITMRHYLGEHAIGETTIPKYLASLAAEATTVINAPDYARTIIDLAVRRRIVAAARQLEAAAIGAMVSVSPAEIAAEAVGEIQQLALTAGVASTRCEPGEAAAAVVARIKRILAGEAVDEGVSTGIPDLDRDTAGFQPGCLWVIGGRPGQGKTILATGFALKVAARGARDARDGLPAAGAMLFSLEVPREQGIPRLLADLAYRPRRPIAFKSIMHPADILNDEDVWCIEDAEKRLAAMPLALDFASSLTVAQITLRVRAEKSRMARRGFRLGVIFLDYLKFIKATDRYRGQLVYEIGEITGALKQLAKDEGICVVLLHQLSRGVEQRDRKDRRPTMADLRSSGDIEADADVVALVYREAYYLKQSPEFHDNDPETLEAYFRCEHEADLILGKSRAGPTGVVKLWCDIGCNTFAAAARGGEA